MIKDNQENDAFNFMQLINTSPHIKFSAIVLVKCYIKLN